MDSPCGQPTWTSAGDHHLRWLNLQEKVGRCTLDLELSLDSYSGAPRGPRASPEPHLGLQLNVTNLLKQGSINFDRPRAGADDERCPHLHDLKIIHMCQTHYTQERVLQAAPAQCADARADLVHGGYLRHARALDARHHAGVRDPDAQPILQRLLQYPAVRGDCVGAFGECSRDLHLLLHDTVHSAAERHWREAGATSARAAVSVYTAIYRRRWGCETALQGARLRLSRAYLAAGGDARHARGAARPTFDPGDADHFAAAASPVLRGLPAGQRD